MLRRLSLLTSFMVLSACAHRSAEVRPASTFWSELTALCGRSFAGTVREAPPGDTTFVKKQLIMHVRQCTENEIRIPFHVGADRSRTWIISRTPNGFRLKHDHRHEDGREDPITQYGGDTRGHGMERLQRFFADAHTIALIPAAVTNVWTVGVEQDQKFIYALHREGTERRYRIEFDLTKPVPTPPPAWGAATSDRSGPEPGH